MMCGVAVTQFSRLVMSEKVLRRLLKQDVVVSIRLSDPNCKRTLYESGRPSNYFILVVEGHVRIHVGSEDFVFDGGPFMFFGAQALTGNDCDKQVSRLEKLWLEKLPLHFWFKSELSN